MTKRKGPTKIEAKMATENILVKQKEEDKRFEKELLEYRNKREKLATGESDETISRDLYKKYFNEDEICHLRLWRICAGYCSMCQLFHGEIGKNYIACEYYDVQQQDIIDAAIYGKNEESAILDPRFKKSLKDFLQIIVVDQPLPSDVLENTLQNFVNTWITDLRLLKDKK